MPYIYKITNQINNKCYIGQTVRTDPFVRWQEHLRSRFYERCANRALYRAMNKYGIEAFIFEVIEEVPIDLVNEKEQYYIQYYNSFHNGYNETLGGDGRGLLELPEDEICQFYLNCLSVQKTAQHFKHDRTTIQQVLYKYNIPTLSSSKIAKINQGNAVAQIDKDTNKIIRIFATVGEADRATGGSKHIGSVCQGKRKTAAGYKWKYVKDILLTKESQFNEEQNYYAPHQTRNEAL